MSKISKVKETVFLEGNPAPICIMENGDIKYPYYSRKGIRWSSKDIVRVNYELNYANEAQIELFESMFNEVENYIKENHGE